MFAPVMMGSSRRVALVVTGVAVGMLAVAGSTAAVTAVKPKATIFQKLLAKPTYACIGAQVKLFDNSNGVGVLNGGKPPTFSTYGKIGIGAYCLNSITTYHWNGGLGQRPGTIGLGPLSFSALLFPVKPRKATGSSGQAGSKNVNWTVDYPGAAAPVVISGIYTCRDSSPTTWSQNTTSAGHGFCTVYATPAYVNNFKLPSGLHFLQPAPATSASSAPATAAPSCTSSTVTNFLIYPNHIAAGGWTNLLLNCGTTSQNSFQGRIAPASVFVIQTGCAPFWTYASSPPQPLFLRYTGQPNAPCMNAQVFVPWSVVGANSLAIRAQNASTGSPLPSGAYTVFVRWSGGDAGAGNVLNVP
jgi:hypothetical protein